MNYLSHAPEDEYEEGKLMYELIKYIKNENDIAFGILEIFTKMFGEDFNKEYKECLYIAKKF